MIYHYILLSTYIYIYIVHEPVIVSAKNVHIYVYLYIYVYIYIYTAPDLQNTASHITIHLLDKGNPIGFVIISSEHCLLLQIIGFKLAL